MKIFISSLLVIIICISNMGFLYAQTEYNYLEKSKLIEKYIGQHKEKIEKFKVKYEIKNNSELNLKISELNEIILILRNINEGKYNDKKPNEIINKILRKIKQINEDLEIILRDEKNKFESNYTKNQKKYSDLSIRLSNSLSKVINKLEIININDNRKISPIKNSISNLKKENEKLKNFGNIQFKNESEIKQSFLRILKNIKRELLEIKKNRA